MNISFGSSYDQLRESSGGNHRGVVKRDRRLTLVEDYNTAMTHASPADRKQAFKDRVGKTLTMGVENSHARTRAPEKKEDAIFKTLESGSYLLIETHGGVYYGVPILHEEITLLKMGGGAMAQVFKCEHYDEREKQRVTLTQPAEFSKKGPDLWELATQGGLTFSNG